MPTLYHYCSAQAFLAIVENSQIWLSSLNQSNDSLEGRMLTETMSQLAKSVNLDESSSQRIQDAMRSVECCPDYDGFGFCLSEASDQLSQWRGYAQDGAGFMIGFDFQELERLVQLDGVGERYGCLLAKVCYSPEQNSETLFQFFEMATDLAKETEGSITEKILGSDWCDFEMRVSRYFMKPSAFSEEREWRLVKFIGTGKERACSFRVRDREIVPYMPLNLRTAAQRSPIVSVMLGPKNQTPEHVVSRFLEKFEHHAAAAEVSRSAASYR